MIITYWIVAGLRLGQGAARDARPVASEGPTTSERREPAAHGTSL